MFSRRIGISAALVTLVIGANAYAALDTNLGPLPFDFPVYVDSMGRGWFNAYSGDTSFTETYDYFATQYDPVTGFPYGAASWTGVRWASSTEVEQLFNEIAATAPTSAPGAGAFQIMQDLGFTDGYSGLLVLNGFTRDQYLVWDALYFIPTDPLTVTGGSFPDVAFVTEPAISADPSFGAWFYNAPPYLSPEPGTLALLGAGLAGIGFARRRKRNGQKAPVSLN